MREPTVLSALTAALLRAAATAGADVATLREAAGLTTEDLADPDGRVSLELHLRVLEAISALPRPIGLEVGGRLGAQGLGVVGYAMQHDATLGSALEWLERYRAVVLDDVVARTEQVNEDGRSKLVFAHVVPPRLVKLREPAELWAAAQLTTLRVLTGRELQPLEVHLPHAAPEDHRRHEAFFHCPIVWSAPRVEVHMDAAILGLPLARANPDLFRYLARRADALKSELPETSIASRVRRLIEEALPNGEPAIDELGRKVAMSGRTLQRRLKEEGTGFAELLDEVRRERAMMLLEDERLTVAQISFLLGYSEPTAFFRAFRRWTGETPQAWRAQR